MTAIATDPGSSAVYGDSAIGGICVPNSRIEIDATNVIARGGLYDFDIPHRCGGGSNAPVEVAYVTHSNFRRTKVNQSAPDSRLEEGGGNQDVERLFASPPALDIHQLAGSPTIDAGVATPLLGSGDSTARRARRARRPTSGRTGTPRPRPRPPTCTGPWPRS